MARQRAIKPEFWEDTKIAKLSAFSRLLYIAMWNFADDEGYLESDPVWLKAKCLPYDTVDISILLKELVDLERVVVEGNLLKITNFLKHQRIDHPQPSPFKKKIVAGSKLLTPTPEVDDGAMAFDKLWQSYPNKDGRKLAEKHFKATVKTEQDYANIQKALSNYLSSDRVKGGYIKSGSTWFNGWKDWLNPTPEMLHNGTGNKPQNTVKGDAEKYAEIK